MSERYDREEELCRRRAVERRALGPVIEAEGSGRYDPKRNEGIYGGLETSNENAIESSSSRCATIDT